MGSVVGAGFKPALPWAIGHPRVFIAFMAATPGPLARLSPT